MKKNILFKLLVCALLLCAGSPISLRAQNAPPPQNAGGPGNGFRGGPGGGFGGFGGGRGRGQTQVGPPAPVPPEVAIPRPTPEEVARIKADFDNFLNTSPDKQLLTNYVSMVIGPRDNPCIRPVAGGQFVSRHQQFMNTVTNGDFDVMFLGDSITDLLNSDADAQGNPGGKPAFDKYFAGMKVANFGISGDTTQGVLWRLQNGEGKGHKPKAVMLMIGTNNTGPSGASGPEIAEGIGAIVLELRKDFPDAKIMLLAIFPRGTGPSDANRRTCEQANKIIARLDDHQHVFFTDINSKFLDANGGLIGFRTSDHLHPVSEGFDIWMSSVAPALKSWVE